MLRLRAHEIVFHTRSCKRQRTSPFCGFGHTPYTLARHHSTHKSISTVNANSRRSIRSAIDAPWSTHYEVTNVGLEQRSKAPSVVDHPINDGGNAVDHFAARGKSCMHRIVEVSSAKNLGLDVSVKRHTLVSGSSDSDVRNIRCSCSPRGPLDRTPRTAARVGRDTDTGARERVPRLSSRRRRGDRACRVYPIERIRVRTPQWSLTRRLRIRRYRRIEIDPTQVRRPVRHGEPPRRRTRHCPGLKDRIAIQGRRQGGGGGGADGR
jgi:hypothetical protein